MVLSFHLLLHSAPVTNCLLIAIDTTPFSTQVICCHLLIHLKTCVHALRRRHRKIGRSMWCAGFEHDRCRSDVDYAVGWNRICLSGDIAVLNVL